MAGLSARLFWTYKMEYVEDKTTGISLGLEYRYRYVVHNGRHVIFDTTDGRIYEVIEEQENDFFTQQKAMRRLYEINGLEQALSPEIRNAIDMEN
jgi:hypothetical protein